jgi:hypothetical protein
MFAWYASGSLALIVVVVVLPLLEFVLMFVLTVLVFATVVFDAGG